MLWSASSAKVNPDTTARGVPIAPSLTSEVTRAVSGSWRYMKPSSTTNRAAAAAAAIRSTSCRIECQRLFAEHVLARCDRGKRPRDVIGIGERNVNRVDARIVEQRLVSGDRARDRPFARVGFGARALAAGHGDKLAPAGEADRRNYATVDARGAENAPAKRHQADRPIGQQANRPTGEQAIRILPSVSQACGG